MGELLKVLENLKAFNCIRVDTFAFESSLIFKIGAAVAQVFLIFEHWILVIFHQYIFGSVAVSSHVSSRYYESILIR